MGEYIQHLIGEDAVKEFKKSLNNRRIKQLAEWALVAQPVLDGVTKAFDSATYFSQRIHSNFRNIIINNGSNELIVTPIRQNVTGVQGRQRVVQSAGTILPGEKTKLVLSFYQDPLQLTLTLGVFIDPYYHKYQPNKDKFCLAILEFDIKSSIVAVRVGRAYIAQEFYPLEDLSFDNTIDNGINFLKASYGANDIISAPNEVIAVWQANKEGNPDLMIDIY